MKLKIFLNRFCQLYVRSLVYFINMFYQQMQIHKNHHSSFDKNLLYNNETKETLVTGRNDF